MSESKHTLDVMERELQDCVYLVDAMEHAIVMIRSDNNKLVDGLNMAADKFRKEADDWRFQIEEVKIHMEQEKNV